ncbi:hypothetical protein CYMTET_8556, partial [Cymbomonas tetramitiformis]
MDNAWHPGTVGEVLDEETTQIMYGNGDAEWLLLQEERTRPIAAQPESKEAPGGAPADERASALRGELGESRYMGALGPSQLTVVSALHQ